MSNWQYQLFELFTPVSTNVGNCASAILTLTPNWADSHLSQIWTRFPKNLKIPAVYRCTYTNTEKLRFTGVRIWIRRNCTTAALPLTHWADNGKVARSWDLDGTGPGWAWQEPKQDSFGQCIDGLPLGNTTEALPLVGHRLKFKAYHSMHFVIKPCKTKRLLKMKWVI